MVSNAFDRSNKCLKAVSFLSIADDLQRQLCEVQQSSMTMDPGVMESVTVTSHIHELKRAERESEINLAAEAVNGTHDLQRQSCEVQQCSMPVDPDVMEYVTTTPTYDELKKTLAAKNSEINWTPRDKTAVIVFRGKGESGSWQSECLEVVKSCLKNFGKRDVEAKKEFWHAVKTQLSNIRACLGIDPPLIKLIDASFCLRIVSNSSDEKVFEEKLNAKLNEIYYAERKSFLKFTTSVPKERFILLEEIKFAEQLQQRSKELEMKLNAEAGEIYFEGPGEQLKEALIKFIQIHQNIVEKQISVSKSILEVLGSDEGLKRMKCELKNNKIEAVFVIDNEARIVGTSATQVEHASRLVGKLTMEEKVEVDETSQHLLKTPEWRQLCDELNTVDVIRVHQNIMNDTFVAGFRQDVPDAMKKVTAFLENNRVRQERFKFSSELSGRYVSERCQDDLRLIESQLTRFKVKIENGKNKDEFVISGSKEGLAHTKDKLNSLVAGVSSTTFEVKQFGLRKFYESGKGDHLEKSTEEKFACAIHVKKCFGTDAQDTEKPNGSLLVAKANHFGEPSINKTDLPKSDRCTLVTKAGHQISWRAGALEVEMVSNVMFFEFINAIETSKILAN